MQQFWQALQWVHRKWASFLHSGQFSNWTSIIVQPATFVSSFSSKRLIRRMCGYLQRIGHTHMRIHTLYHIIDRILLLAETCLIMEFLFWLLLGRSHCSPTWFSEVTVFAWVDGSVRAWGSFMQDLSTVFGTPACHRSSVASADAFLAFKILAYDSHNVPWVSWSVVMTVERLLCSNR